jgi:hypothetical protein
MNPTDAAVGVGVSVMASPLGGKSEIWHSYEARQTRTAEEGLSIKRTLDTSSRRLSNNRDLWVHVQASWVTHPLPRVSRQVHPTT